MGTFSVKIRVGDLDGQKSEEMDAMVDTGAATTVVPASTLRRIGIEPVKSEVFEYAGGAQIRLDMGYANVRVNGKETITWVVFGEETGATLLGAYTLEGVMLGVDPSAQQLIPVHGTI